MWGGMGALSDIDVSPFQGKENNPAQALGSAEARAAQGLAQDSPPAGQQNARVTPHPAYDPNVRVTPTSWYVPIACCCLEPLPAQIHADQALVTCQASDRPSAAHNVLLVEMSQS